jgi:phospho-N-acetylmuramoyl-pentapeptide-transferase
MILPLPTMAYSLVAATLGFLVAVIVGQPVINFLRARKVGKAIRIDGPTTHLVKTGTPTMGGLIIGLSVVIVTLVFNLSGRLSILLPFSMMASCGLLGGVDDWMGLVGSKGGGLKGRFKMAWLLAIATTAALILYFQLMPPTFIPFVNARFDIGEDIGLWYIPMAILLISGFSNAVNLTDGLDSLAGYTAATAFVCYGVIAYLQGQSYLVTFCFTVAGAVLGFLWFNAHPAQVFMGDTGSLALGATLAVVALMTGHWLILPIIGLVFVAEAGSSMLQVAFFKLTRGKRLFKMAPLHHHFELLGWSEVQVAQRFWLVAILSGMLGIALALA